MKKFTAVAKELATLKPGEHSIKGIIRKIKDVQNLKLDLDKLVENSDLYQDYGDTCKLEDMYVDITYQRKVRLQKLINQLESLKKFDIKVAGTIDVILRPKIGKHGRYYVWDGLRRALMYGLCGGEVMRVSSSKHAESLSNDECIQEEARLFKIRNADAEKMTPEEIFKSQVVYGDEIALDQFSILKNADLDVEGLNPEGMPLGGFTLFDKCYMEAKEEGILKEFRMSILWASKLIQCTWPKDEKVSLYVLCGLAYLVRLNDEFTDGYSYDDMYGKFQTWKFKGRIKGRKKPRKQSDITDVRLHGKAILCIAYYIARHIIKDKNGLVITLKQSLKDRGVNDDGLKQLEYASTWETGL